MTKADELGDLRAEVRALRARIEAVEHDAGTTVNVGAPAPVTPPEPPEPSPPAETARTAPPSWLLRPQTGTDWAKIASTAIAAITLLAVAVRGLVDILRRGIYP